MAKIINNQQSIPERVPIQPEQKKNVWNLRIATLLGIIILAFAAYFLARPTTNKIQSINSDLGSKLLNKTDISPTPFPFQELTVPYLRAKTYESRLGEKELLADNGSYLSYLSSFTSDGFKINGLLTIPQGTEPEKGWPAIIFIHGYIPPTQYQTTGQYADYVDYLARSGFVVFKIDLRGHADSEGDPGGGYYGSDYITDTLSAYSALQRADFVNKDAIGLWGHSMAGNIVMRSIAAKPDIPAGVIWAGAVYSYLDWQKYGISDSSYSPPQMSQQRQSRRRELFEKHGSPSAQSAFWQQVAPTNYLGDLKGSIQIHHAVDDDVVDIGYSRDLMKVMDKTSVSHELFEYSSGGHNISGSSFNSAMQRTVEFFQDTLK